MDLYKLITELNCVVHAALPRPQWLTGHQKMYMTKEKALCLPLCDGTNRDKKEKEYFQSSMNIT